MSVQIRKTGFNFMALSENLRRNISDELNSAAESCVSLAKQLAPVSDINTTGYVHMRDAINQTEKATPTELKAVVESPKDYSAFVEFGTVNMDAQPFFTPSFESARRQLNNALLRVLR